MKRYTRAMRFFKAILAFALLSTVVMLSTQAAPSSDGVYVGTLGTSSIVLKLETFAPDEVSATYYYRRVGRDIQLRGLSRANGTFKLTEITLPNREDLARLELTLKGAALSGTWAELKGRQRVYNVNLRKVVASDFAALRYPSTPAFKQWISENPLDALRFDAPMKTAKLETVTGKRVQWMTEPKSKITFPRLPRANASMNNVLILEHYRIASEQLQCEGDYYTYSSKVSLYSSRILSLSGTNEHYCMSAYPDTMPVNYTFDLLSARELILEDLYRFTPFKINLDSNSEEFRKYVIAQANVLQGLILTKYGSMVAGIGIGCQRFYDGVNNLYDPSWFLTTKGLVVQSSLPHVANVCEDSYELPYSSLVKYLAPSSPLR